LRAYKKNDNALVEIKNWTMVRAYLGYRRYSTDEEYEIIKRLLSLIELKHNLFIPTMKIKRREYTGSKYRKIYETKTPYTRLMESEEVSEEKKSELTQLKKSINLYKLSREIAMLLNKLDKAYERKHASKSNFGLNIELNSIKFNKSDGGAATNVYNKL